MLTYVAEHLTFRNKPVDFCCKEIFEFEFWFTSSRRFKGIESIRYSSSLVQQDFAFILAMMFTNRQCPSGNCLRQSKQRLFLALLPMSRHIKHSQVLVMRLLQCMVRICSSVGCADNKLSQGGSPLQQKFMACVLVLCDMSFSQLLL